GGRSRRSDKEVVHGCAFAGTMCVTLSVDGLATVLHAPRDCAHYAVQMVTNAMRRSFTNGDIPIRPFARPNVRCSEMDDPDMIFGSVDSLEAAISDTIRGGNRTIAVVTSCPSGIIGEDIGGMIERISKEHTDVTLIPIIEDGNIKGDYMQGATDACLRLIRGLSEKGKKERSVNLVGVKTFGINTLGNIEFMSSVLKRLNVKVNCTCVGNTSVSEIQNIPNASLCVLMTPDTIATETMDLLRNEFGLKATANTARPGMMETELLIRELGEHFSEEERAERLIGELRREYADRLGMLRPRLINKKIYIVGMKRDIGWLMETAVGAGMNVVRCVVIDITDRSEMNDLENVYGTEMIPAGIKSNLKRMKDRTERILDPYIPVDPEMNAWIKNDLRERMPDLLLSTYPIDEKIRTCFLDVNPDTTPFAGPDFASLWSRTIRTPSKEGWKEDVI
ncbi:MAG: nitrogenase component 1, partial [Methanomassiliicoccaceae archaeon]|nr:nitrogenase component 1 [Methanomassiliicoccaceae archaeon]